MNVLERAVYNETTEREYAAKGYSDLSTVADEVRAVGQIEEAIKRAQGICNLIENTNECLGIALDRLNGSAPSTQLGGNAGRGPELPAGQIGALVSTLDRLYELASRTSGYASNVSRL